MKRALLVFLVAISVALGGCSKLVKSDPATVTIVNQLGNWNITAVYFSSSDGADWGNDRLGSSDILHPGDSRAFTVAAGKWDIRVKDQDGDTYTVWSFTLESGKSYQWLVGLSDIDR
jgi:hypothetical protein